MYNTNLLPKMEECGEGHIGQFPERQEKLVEFINTIKPINLIEIGFNNGNSAILICQTIDKLIENDDDYKNKKINFFIFDICRHPCSKTNFEILKEKYQNKINLNFIEGSSVITLKEFMSNNELLFDFIEIDGGHDFYTLTSDIQNTINFLKTEGLMYIDDYNSYPHALDGVNKGVDEYNWDGFDHDSIQGLFWAVKKA
jgi:predicted O-methyltransferase YrrM